MLELVTRLATTARAVPNHDLSGPCTPAVWRTLVAHGGSRNFARDMQTQLCTAADPTCVASTTFVAEDDATEEGQSDGYETDESTAAPRSVSIIQPFVSQCVCVRVCVGAYIH